MSLCSVCGDVLGVVSSNKKLCTSCAQKMNCKEDGGSSIKSPNVDADIVVISNDMKKMICNDDDEIFKDPPPKEECPLCMLPMPRHSNANYGIQTTYQPCCGKTLCWGCAIAFLNEMDKGKLKRCCAFCRVPIYKSNNELVKRIKKRMKMQQ